MRMQIHHTTTYRYQQSVAHSIQYLRLTPVDSPRQKVISWNLRLPVGASPGHDPYGNVLHVMTLDFPHQDIVIEAEGCVEVEDCARELEGALPPLLFLRTTPLTCPDAAIRQFAAPLGSLARVDTELAAWQLLEALRARVEFQPGETDVCTTAAEAFGSARGVCQDFAHAYLACARSIGIPARYVSGYLLADSSDHVASHAWVEVWTGRCWWGLDVANGIEAGHAHLKLAIGMDYLDACPVRGVRSGGGGEQLDARALVRMSDQ